MAQIAKLFNVPAMLMLTFALVFSAGLVGCADSGEEAAPAAAGSGEEAAEGSGEEAGSGDGSESEEAGADGSDKESDDGSGGE